MRNKRSEKGFSLAEVLIVVAIIAIIITLAIVSVFSYLRGMTKLEYDGYAKEIFVAAQNHLSMSESQGYLGRTEFGTEEEEIPGISDTGDGVYYFVITTDHSKVKDGNSVLNLMLPTAAVDDTIRLGGSYIVRYHKDSAKVLDVFYWMESGSRFSHNYSNSDYPDFLSKRNDKSALRYYETDKSVIGYYGGAEAASLTYGETLRAPEIKVTNAEKLTVTVTDHNRNSDLSKNVSGAKLKLIITGLTSHNSREITLDPTDILSTYYSPTDMSNDAEGWLTYNIVLDDITAPGKHFNDLFCKEGVELLIPGEDVTIQAVSYNNEVLTNIAYSSEQTTNSLFAYNTSGDNTAHVAYFRHLENLDQNISALAYTDTDLDYVVSGASKNSVAAKQVTDLSWDSFPGGYIYAASTSVLPAAAMTKTEDTFQPVSPSYVLTYAGQGHTISGIDVDTTSYPDGAEKSAGLFGKLEDGSVCDLMLRDFTVAGTDAGALAGYADNTSVTNVIATVSEYPDSPSVTGSGNVGGLIGSAEGASVEKSAAAIPVRSTGADAGGLVGKATDGTEITACYSAGHTVNGYYTTDFNVIAAENAGGLVGNATDAVISYSYSTCSASGSAVGGFVGTASGGSIDVCYSTGLVSGTTAGAFAATLTGETVTECRYFAIVNELEDPVGGYTYLSPLSSGDDPAVTPIDSDAAAYNGFVGSDRNGAAPYDASLTKYYQGNYSLLTVAQLGASVNSGDFVSVHYGDWPSPEVRVINTK